MNVSDPTAEKRKKDHIELAFQSQVHQMELDKRFYYEPMLSGHPTKLPPQTFLGKQLRAPIWVSSMTGGTEKARIINTNLAKACSEFGMGMGLGSCRSLLESDEYLSDFDVRSIIGDQLPFYANLGIAQIEELIRQKQTEKVGLLLDKLRADGLFIHVNPLQEWLQPEGDKIQFPPIETIQKVIELLPEVKIIVKEVGQGMGKASLSALMKMPIAAIEFAAHGGTNFSKLELFRNDVNANLHYGELTKIGHSAEDMVEMVNEILEEQPKESIRCKTFIISGGVKHFLDGHYLINQLNATAVYGQASTLLKYAQSSYEELQQFLNYQIKGLALAKSYLRIRK